MRKTRKNKDKKISIRIKFDEPEKKLIRAAWLHNEMVYILCLTNHITELTKKYSKKFGLPEEKIRVGTTEDLVKEIIHHNTRILISVRDGKPLYDPLKLLHSLKINIEKGLMIGTKEGILRKFLVIKEHLKEIDKIKVQVFDNIYISTIEASQTALILRNHVVLVPRLIPNVLREYMLGRGLEKSQINDAEEIIRLYKAYEHKKIQLPAGRKLDELSKKAERFREAVKKLK
jgi:hypothetical protein